MPLHDQGTKTMELYVGSRQDGESLEAVRCDSQELNCLRLPKCSSDSDTLVTKER